MDDRGPRAPIRPAVQARRRSSGLAKPPAHFTRRKFSKVEKPAARINQRPRRDPSADKEVEQDDDESPTNQAQLAPLVRMKCEPEPESEPLPTPTSVVSIEIVEPSGPPPLSKESQEKLELLGIPGNNVCADCMMQNPDWVHLDHGIFICLECCGVHRSFSNKTRSFMLDKLSPYEHQYLRSRGNKRVNEEWEASLDEQKPPADADHTMRESFIRRKWIQGAFKARPPPPSPSSPSEHSLEYETSSRSPSPLPSSSPPHSPVLRSQSEITAPLNDYSPSGDWRENLTDNSNAGNRGNSSSNNNNNALMSAEESVRQVGVLVFCPSYADESLTSLVTSMLQRGLPRSQSNKSSFQTKPNIVVQTVGWKEEHATNITERINRIYYNLNERSHSLLDLAWVSALPQIGSSFEDLCIEDRLLLKAAREASDKVAAMIGPSGPVVVFGIGMGSVMAVRYLTLLAKLEIRSTSITPPANVDRAGSFMNTTCVPSPRKPKRTLFGAFRRSQKLTQYQSASDPALMARAVVVREDPAPSGRSNTSDSSATQQPLALAASSSSSATTTNNNSNDTTVSEVQPPNRQATAAMLASGIGEKRGSEGTAPGPSFLTPQQLRIWSPLSAAETLCLLVTLGCPLPIVPQTSANSGQPPHCEFAVPHKRLTTHNLPKMYHKGWLNFYSADDPWSFPLNHFFSNAAVSDTSVAVKERGNYLKDKIVIRAVTDAISQIYGQVNAGLRQG